MSKKKKYLILLFAMLGLAAVTAGIYIFVNPNAKNLTSYTVNKYSEVVNWCEDSLKDGKLSVDCKALLTGIDINNCFEVQVITKEKELKNLTVCEKNDNLSYTNDVLGYKQLMPVNIVFVYVKEGILGNYSFNNVEFKKIDDTYLQNIVNEDIANLVNIDPSSTTIENSVDFCPKSETLPSYITEENKVKYDVFYNKNIMPVDNYGIGSLYNLDDSTIRLLFTCDSRSILKETTGCKATKIPLTSDILNSIKSNPLIPKSGGNLSEYEQYMLKKASLLYDSSEYVNFSDNSKILDSLIVALNSRGDLNEEVYCGIYKLLKMMNLKEFSSYIEKIEKKIYSNISNLSSMSCQSSINTTIIDKNGLYLKNFYSHTPKNFTILNKCSNLGYMLNN